MKLQPGDLVVLLDDDDWNNGRAGEIHQVDFTIPDLGKIITIHPNGACCLYDSHEGWKWARFAPTYIGDDDAG